MQGHIRAVELSENFEYYERSARCWLREIEVENKVWFGFRLKDGGSIVLKGPYSYDGAMKKRERMKASDAEVSHCFVADTTESAMEKARFFMP